MIHGTNKQVRSAILQYLYTRYYLECTRQTFMQNVVPNVMYIPQQVFSPRTVQDTPRLPSRESFYAISLLQYFQTKRTCDFSIVDWYIHKFIYGDCKFLVIGSVIIKTHSLYIKLYMRFYYNPRTEIIENTQVTSAYLLV